ncbi:MAG: SxtJ family membrane protein [Thermodesulfobacteriota bacterium]
MKIVEEIREEIHAAYREPTGRDLTLLAIVFLVGFGLIGSYFLFWKGKGSGYVWLCVGVGLALLRVIPPLFRLVYRLWISFSVCIGYFVSRLILTSVFFLVITPIGIIMRILGKDPMDRKIDKAAESYWQPKTDQAELTVERYERQF